MGASLRGGCLFEFEGVAYLIILCLESALIRGGSFSSRAPNRSITVLHILIFLFAWSTKAAILGFSNL